MERDAGPSARGKGGGLVERREEEAGWATGPRGEGEGKLGPRLKLSCGLGRAGTGIWVGFLLFSLSFLFPISFQIQLNYLNSKTTLNSSTYALKPKKQMHQHVCTNKLALKINFNYLCNKIRLNAI